MPHRLPHRRVLVLLLAAAGALAALPAHADPQAALAALREPGTVVLMRHARAPGVGDPAGFKLGDCSTQRNLNDEGRADARAAGQRLRAAGVKVGKLLSSPWCRCLETARLLDLGPVVADPAFGSTFRSETSSDDVTAAARRVIADWRGPGVLLAVTHQVNIQALTGRSTSSGEMIVLKRQADGGLREVGALE
ncbi:histidine phosphatase family protein [Aquincola sp. J276]|uniref:histidine phosphatase family protein n=1 Tax=Aquincola sp. J276 TaxID=2898432 RepID=UPI0021515BFD|nr:histidine phosphatase family protein [Aquincola sp. J276]MCR5864008.1 histidine phosphatase family protein [Aquincola sp. J276]